MSTSIYSKEELMTTAAYLRSLYGDRLPGRDEENVWKMSEIEMYHKSPIFSISNYFWIPDKNQRPVLLRPFAGQAILDLCIETQRRAGLPQRVVGFKSRQVGWSTWMLARSLHQATSSPNKRAMFLVPDEDVAAVMATRLGAMLTNLPRFLQAMRRIQNIKHLVFDNPNPKERMDNPGLGSELQITVPSPMRGIPPQMLTISEYSHMPSDAQFHVSTSILPGMPNSENSLVVIDTTPNGFDDFYEPLVREAYDANPKWIRRLEDSPGSYTAEEILSGAIGVPENLYGDDAAWLLAFERWDWHEEYAVRCREFPRGERRKPPPKIWKEFVSDIGKNKKYGGEEELELQGRYGIAPEKLYWRRTKMNSYKMPTDEMRLATFHQEFAMSIEGGFIELDKTPFDRDCLEALMRQQRDPIARGLLDTDDKGTIGVRHSLASRQQEWRIYAPPERGEKYAFAIDTNNAYESEEADATAMGIMRHRDRKLCAIYTGRVPEHILRRQAFLAYQWYYHPYTGVEAVQMGYQLIRSLIGMGLHNYYSFKRVDIDSPEPTKYPGWYTNAQTRPIMDAKFIEALCWRDPDSQKPMPQMIIPDREALKQIQGIRRGDSGSLKHAHGKDDIFDMLCICLCLFDDPYGGFHKKKEEPQREQQEEFERLFRATTGGAANRNRPTLAQI
jgi:hypothetical protein